MMAMVVLATIGGCLFFDLEHDVPSSIQNRSVNYMGPEVTLRDVIAAYLNMNCGLGV